jgi:hypothetical protein
LQDQHVDTERTYVVPSADMCYVGQSFDVHVPLPDVLEHITLPDAIARFRDRAFSRAPYGYLWSRRLGSRDSLDDCPIANCRCHVQASAGRDRGRRRRIECRRRRDEMAMVAYRTAHTVFVKETQDYATTLVSKRGEVFASPRRYGVLTMLAMPMDDTIKAIGDDFEEDDIFITNDSEATRGMATHLPDVFFWKPIFHRGQLVCWAWSFIHSSDVGGKVPGSISSSSYEIQHEGIRVPPAQALQARRCG